MKLLETDPLLVGLMNSILDSRMTESVSLQKTLCFRLRKEAAHRQAAFASCFAECYLADYYAAKLDTKRCFRQLSRALALCKASDYIELTLFIYNLYGVAYAVNGESGMAIDCYLEGVALAHRHRNLEYLAKLYSNIGDCFLRLCCYDKARLYTRKALACFRRAKRGEIPAYVEYIIINNLADIYVCSDQPQTALDLLDGYVAASGEAQHDLVLCVQRGLALAKLGDWPAALERFDRFECSKNNTGDKELFADLVIRIANAAIAAKDAAHADKCRGLLSAYAPYDSFVIAQRIAELDIAFFEAFGPAGRLSDAYAEYYRVSCELALSTRRERARSIGDRIKLYRAVEKNAEIMQHNKRLKDISGVDELSKLPNRRALNEYLDRAVETAGPSPVGVVVFDIDHFKKFNDTHGHLVGDKVLRLVAACLVDDDERFYPTRFGGDEFITVCSSCPDEDIEAYIERCFSRVRASQSDADADVFRITVSAGYYSSPAAKGASGDSFILRADQALYEAKCRSRDCFVAYKDLFPSV